VAAINIYPRGGNDYSSFVSDICSICSKVHLLNSPNNFLCTANGMPGTQMVTTVVATDLPSSDYVAVAFGNSVFCAVGPNICATSADGQTWVARAIGKGNWKSITWNASNLFVAVGLNCIATSANGTTWVIRVIPPGDYNVVRWNGTVFCALGNNCCATSTDGTTWTARTVPAGNWQGLVCNAGTLSIAVSNGGPNAAMTSTDAIAWTARAGLPAGAYYAIDYNGSNLYVVVGDSVTYNTADGLTWTAGVIPAGKYRAIRWNGSLFATVGLSIAASSAVGATFIARTITAANYFGVDWNASNLFVAVGDFYNAYGAAGTSWTQHAETASPLDTLKAGSFVSN
jgi:hypothetical protein